MSRLTEKSVPSDLSASSLSETAAAIAAAWEEARLVYPLYFFLATHFHLEPPPTRDANLPVACPASKDFERILGWLDQMDTRVRTNQLRQLLHSVKDVKPDGLKAFILRLLRRPEKTSTDRDNMDLLLAQYFALCAPEDLYATEITLADVAQVLRGVIGEAEATELEWCAPLDKVLNAMKQCHSLSDVFSSRLLEKGRQLKDTAGFMFYDPAALVAFTRFNFMLRRSFFRLLHSDLRAIREGLTELERRGIASVDCTSAGLSAKEPVAHLREISDSWRQPLPKDYAEESANRTFEQLLAIRAAIEGALGIVSVKADIPEIDTVAEAAGEISPQPAPPPEKSDRKPGPQPAQTSVREVPAEKAMPKVAPPNLTEQETPAGVKSSTPSPARPHTRESKEIPPANKTKSDEPAAASKTPSPAAETAKPIEISKKPALERPPAASSGNAPSLDLEQCLENIWEQLIEAPPTRGRSMSTVTLGEARVLLSAWEVNAFVSDGGKLSDDLRRAVAARAYVTLAREEKKRTGDPAKLNAAIALGRQEMTYLQERVEEAQRTKNTEAAVNLGITARRLLSAMEEAQQN